MSTEKNLTNLVINKVESQDVYDYMKANNLINADELYVVAGGDQIATETDDGLMSSEDKIKLDNIEENANNYIHPAYTPRSNGLYKVTIDSTGHVSNVTAIEKDDITDLGIPAQDTTYSEATTSSSGLMSATDKAKLDSIPAEKGNYQYLVTDGEGNTMWEDRLGYKAVIKNVVVEKSAAAFQSHMSYKGTYCSERLPFFDSSLSYAIVTVDGVEYELHGSNGIVGNQYLASDSMEDTGEPVCLKMDVDIETSEFGCLIITNLSGSTHDIVISVPEETVVKIPEEYMPYEFVKVEAGKGLSTNDYTTAEKTKLSNIEDGANKTIVDTALSSTSTNPVQNKVINTKLNSMQSDIDSKVPSTRTVNGKALSANITLSASDVGALPNTTQIPSIDGLATETYVDNKVAGLVDSAPATLDTLNELAAALGDDPNFATTVATQIGTKVDKVDGKGLSTNDYTTTEKTKLSGIAAGAEVNQNAFSNVVVGSATISADSKTDTLTLVAGNNVTITPDATNDKITIAATDTTYSAAGTSLGLVQSGGDVTIKSGVITVNDDSHNHIIANVDGLQASIDSKVDKVTGKGLSTNDLTNVLKANYDTAYTHSQQAHAPANAEKNVIVGVQKNGADLTVNSSTRKVNITVPTKTSELTNDSSFVTTTDLDAKADAPFKPEGKSYLTFSSPNSFTLKVNDTTKHWDGTLEYFASDKTWTIWDGTTTLTAVDNDGEYVLYMRGTGNTKITGQGSSYKWVLNGSNIACIGNIETLLDYATIEAGNHPTMAFYCYSYMFNGCASLVQAPALPATTLVNSCYDSMFSGCTSLIQAPILPATTLSTYCYQGMFNG